MRVPARAGAARVSRMDVWPFGARVSRGEGLVLQDLQAQMYKILTHLFWLVFPSFLFLLPFLFLSFPLPFLAPTCLCLSMHKLFSLYNDLFQKPAST
jgi:uncharacterized membrane protein YccF (DUF307 family)